MRVEGIYPPPVLGVSTLSPRNRTRGKAGVQKNFRSDTIKKLTRRPPLVYKTDLTTGISRDNVYHHRFARDNVIYRIVIDKSTGDVFGFVDEAEVTVEGDLSGYIGDNITLHTIEDTTYVLNKDKKVRTLSDTDVNDIERVSHINITSALAYSETLTVNVTLSTGTRYTVSYTVPALISSGNPEDPPDYDTADQARATKQVASSLATSLNNLVGVTAESLGSSVAVWEDGRANWLDVEVETGQGDRSAVAINRTVERVDGLPLYAVVGTRITVRPNPTSEKGIYYLQAERTSDLVSTEPLEEVVWAESRNPEQEFSLDNTTMPHECVFDVDADKLIVTPVDWKERKAGDDDSVPVPEFVDNTITELGYFQKRLVFLSENFAIMSETDDVKNFWRQSAVTLLVNDKVAVASSAVDIDKLQFVVPHNRDLLIIASNGQFKINGKSAITPETVSMPLTTKYDCQISVPPVTMGNSVFFPIDYGESTGIQEYTGEKDTGQDFAKAITHEVIGYISGEARVLTASPNLSMIALLSGTSTDSTLFIYERGLINKKEEVESWSEWEFGGGAEILDATFTDDELELICHENDTVFVKTIRMYTKVTNNVDIYLDDLLVLDTIGTAVNLPNAYVKEDLLCIRGEGTDNELYKVGFTQTGNALVFDENIGAGKVYVGKAYESRYRPTRPFRYTEDGQAITTDRVRIGRFILGLVDTNEIKMHIDSEYYSIDDQVFNSRYVNGLNNVLGTVPFYTGDYKFSFAQDANLAEAEFYCDNWLGCTINSISWEGQYFQSKGRI